MRSRIPDPIQAAAAAAAVLLVLLLSGCQTAAPNTDAALADRLEKLPTLPADIAATLDPKTKATKMAGPPPDAIKLPSPLPAAPCCSSKVEKALKVNVPLTYCGTLHDLVLAPISDLVLARETVGAGAGGAPAGSVGREGNVRVYKYGPINRANPWGSILCTTSNGPWDATFIEERHCNNYSPVDSLYVSAWGKLYAYYWNQGPANHPPEVSVVSCSDVGTTRFLCGVSTCDCTSNFCPPNQLCPCTPPW